MDPDPFLMANVSPAMSGLPFIVYISEAQGSDEPWVKVMPDATNSAFVAVGENADVIEGELSALSHDLVRQWIDVNRAVIVAYWHRKIEGTADALAALKPLPKP